MNAFRLIFSLSIFLFVSLISYSQDQFETTLIENYENGLNEKAKTEALIDLVEFYGQNNLIKADSLDDVLYDLSLQTNDYWQSYMAGHVKAEIDYDFGRRQKYIDFHIKSEKYLDSLPEGHKREFARYYFANALRMIGEINQSQPILTQINTVAKKRKDYDLVARSYRSLGSLMLRKKISDSAYFYFTEGIKYAKRSRDKKIFCRLLNNLSSYYSYIGKDGEGMAKKITAVELAKKYNFGYLQATYSNGVGLFQKIYNNNSEALYYYKIAANIGERIKSERLLGIVYSNIGVVYKEQGNYDKAFSFHTRAINILENLDTPKQLGDAYTNLGVVLNKKEQYKEALEYYEKALGLFKQVKNDERISRVLQNIGIAETNLGNYHAALEHLNRSLKIKEKNNYSSLYSTYLSLSKVNSKLKHYEKAYKQLNKYQEYSDSIQEIRLNSRVTELSAQYRAEQRAKVIQDQEQELKQKEQEKLIREQKLEVTTLKNDQKTYVILGILLLMILVATMGYARYKQARLKEQQKEAQLNQTLLRAQMNPHFVFNAMSVIQSYIYDNDVKNSSKFLVNFSKLMRLILENSPKEFIPITLEEDILNKYLVVQKLRFEDRFEFNIDIDPNLIESDAVIPPMLTQPFIENAIEHGQLHTIEDGTINILFKKSGSNLIVEIIDNGVGRDKANENKKASAHKSMAMKITRERIELLNTKYKQEGYMKVEDANKVSKRGTHVTLSIPLQSEFKLK